MQLFSTPLLFILILETPNFQYILITIKISVQLDSLAMHTRKPPDFLERSLKVQPKTLTHARNETIKREFRHHSDLKIKLLNDVRDLLRTGQNRNRDILVNTLLQGQCPCKIHLEPPL